VWSAATVIRGRQACAFDARIIDAQRGTEAAILADAGDIDIVAAAAEVRQRRRQQRLGQDAS